MSDYQFSLAEHACSTIKDHQRARAGGLQGPSGMAGPLMQEISALSGRVDGFIEGFPKRVVVKKGVSTRRLTIAFLVYLGTLFGQLWFFNGHSVFDLRDTAEIAAIVFRDQPDSMLYAKYVYWFFICIFAMMSMALAFLGTMVLCLALSIFRFKWVNSVFEALCTAAGSVAVTYVYYHYLPFLKIQVEKILS